MNDLEWVIVGALMVAAGLLNAGLMLRRIGGASNIDSGSALVLFGAAGQILGGMYLIGLNTPYAEWTPAALAVGMLGMLVALVGSVLMARTFEGADFDKPFPWLLFFRDLAVLYGGIGIIAYTFFM